MSASGDFVTTEEAARLLGVTVQHLRRLADSGAVTRLARGVIDRGSVDKYMAAHPISRTRAWAEHTAWGAIAMLSGVGYPDWLGPTQASRLRNTLRHLTDPADLVARTRDRAVVRTYAGHSAALRTLVDRVVVPDDSVLGLTAASTDRIDGYIAADSVDSTVAFFGLREDHGGAITLRITGFPIAIVEEVATAHVVSALDAATSTDPRTRAMAEAALSGALEAYRG